MLWISHSRVGPVAEVRVPLEELLVAQVKQIALWIVQTRVGVLVQVSVSVTTLKLTIQAAKILQPSIPNQNLISPRF